MVNVMSLLGARSGTKMTAFVRVPYSYWPCVSSVVRLRDELTRGPPELVQHLLSFTGGVQIGPRALHGLNLIWFGNIARLS